jgi:hypothetical protein
MKFTKNLLGAFALVGAILAPMQANAVQTLAYFDASSSAVEYHQNFAQDFEKYVAKAKVGDTFILSRIGLESSNFAPFGTYTLEAPAKGLSSKRKKELEAEARDDIVTAVPIALKKPTEVDATNIIGALTSANDYFKAKNVPVNERVILLFTDGMEQSKINKINMAKGIPKTLPAKLVLPAGLNAKVYMIGIYPPNKAGAQEAMRNFWQQVMLKTGSTLEMFLQRYP